MFPGLDCCWPQSRVDGLARPQLYRFVWYRLWLVVKRLNREHVLRVKLKRAGQLDSTLSYNTCSVVEHRSRRPVLAPHSPQCSCVDRCRVWPYCVWGGQASWAGGPWTGLHGWTFKDISVHRTACMRFDDLKHLVACRFAPYKRIIIFGVAITVERLTKSTRKSGQHIGIAWRLACKISSFVWLLDLWTNFDAIRRCYLAIWPVK